MVIAEVVDELHGLLELRGWIDCLEHHTGPTWQDTRLRRCNTQDQRTYAQQQEGAIQRYK